MSVVTISRGSYSRGKEVAEKLARKMGYQCSSRDILLKASKDFNIPEIKLVRAIHDAPSVLERFTHGKERYLAFLRSALLKTVQADNVVYHGLAGHFFLQGIPHVLKVRIIADIELRVAEEMRREGISEDEARRILEKDDAERRKWGQYVFGRDPWECHGYDLVINIHNMTTDDAADIIGLILSKPRFRTTPQSQAKMDALCLSAQVQAALVEAFPTAQVTARGKKVFVDIRASLVREAEIQERVKTLAQAVIGDGELFVNVLPVIPVD